MEISRNSMKNAFHSSFFLWL